MDVTIDCAAIGSREAFHTAFAGALSLPAWYGRNLDALHDCLSELPGETRLRLLRWDAMEDTLGRYAVSAKKAILHAASRNPGLSVIIE